MVCELNEGLTDSDRKRTLMDEGHFISFVNKISFAYQNFLKKIVFIFLILMRRRQADVSLPKKLSKNKGFNTLFGSGEILILIFF